jgi:catechol 2,3-dioxygenase-like lactoylglutathione lyase family enzyme
MSRYVDPTEQLVTEIVVKDIRRSVDFYRRLGFELLRDGGDFVELTWEDHRLFLRRALRVSRRPWSATNHTSAVSHRQRQSDWKLANEIGAHIIIPVADRYYGLRDFTIADQDDFGLRFRSML